MALTQQDYLRQMQALLPLGPAWPRDEDASITRILSGLATELARIDARALGLIEEADPRTATELFLEWEAEAGLPDECAIAFGGEQSIAQRRAALLGRLTTLGGQSVAYFVGLAQTLGFTITITEYRLHDCNDDCEYPIYDTPWAFAWQVNAPLNTITELSCEDDCEMPIRVWGNALLECVLKRLKPAHTILNFSYT